MNELYGTRSLREIARILFQHWFLLAVIVAAGTAGTWLYCRFIAERTYRSEVSLIFKRPLNKDPISTDRGERGLEVFVKAQQQIVMSDLVLARAKVISEDPTLRDRWYKLRDRWEAVRTDPGADIEPAHREITGFLADAAGPRVRRLLEMEQEELEKFRDSVELETPGGEQVAMTESFTLMVDRPSAKWGERPHELAAHAADILADMYVVRFRELQEALSKPAIRVMSEVLAAYDREVKGKIDAYEAFVRENAGDIGVLEQLLKSGDEHGIQVIATRVRESDAMLGMELARDKAVHEVLVRVLPEKVFEAEGLGSMSDSEVASAIETVPVDFLEGNTAIEELVKYVAKLEGKRAKLGTQFTDESRELKYAHEEIARSKRQILAAIAAQAKGLRATIAARERQRVLNRELIERSLEDQNRIHAKLATYAMLRNDFEVAQRHLEPLNKEKMDALANRLRAGQAVTISKLSAASVPDMDRPVSPKTLLYTLAAFLATSLLAVAFAFFLDHFDHTLRSSVEAERYLGVPVLGSIKKRGARLVVSG